MHLRYFNPLTKTIDTLSAYFLIRHDYRVHIRATTGHLTLPPHHVRHEIEHKCAHLVHRAAAIKSGSRGHDTPFALLRLKRIYLTAHCHGWINTSIPNPTNTPTRDGPSCDSGRHSTTLLHKPKPERHIQVPRPLTRRARRGHV